nr:hypothetical protein [Tanacetum cinerariifolium]
ESDTLKKQKVQEQIDAQVARELEEQLEREDHRRSEQIARDVEIVRIHAEEELQIMISQQRKPLTKKQKRDYYIAVIRSNLGWKVKDFRTSEEVTKEAKSPDEVPEEKVKEMLQLVPIEEVYVEAIQVEHPIIDWKVHTEGQRNYWKITTLGGSSASYQFFIDLLKHLDKEDLN